MDKKEFIHSVYINGKSVLEDGKLKVINKEEVSRDESCSGRILEILKTT